MLLEGELGLSLPDRESGQLEKDEAAQETYEVRARELGESV